MDPTGPMARRFPLIARPRPPCTSLATRIGELHAQAAAAAQHNDLTAASAVCNQAALIASDCGLPSLARRWCHQHAKACLRASPSTAQAARRALEPLINLARLHIRNHDADAAFHLLDTLYRAINSRTDTIIDGIEVPAARLTQTTADHQELRRWVWAVHLADGTRAFTSAGRWQDALHHLRRRAGIGQRMLDGRQVAIIAAATAGDLPTASALIDTATPGDPWEAAVTAVLTVLTHSHSSRTKAQKIATMAERYRRLDLHPRQSVFLTRLGLSAIDAIGSVEHPYARDIATAIIQQAAAFCDGYTARDILAHNGCSTLLTEDQARTLAQALTDCALGQRCIPEELGARMSDAVATCETVLVTRN